MAEFATSLKLSKALKSRIARLAKRHGETSHALMLRMLEEQVEDAERFERFIDDSRSADLQMEKTGEGYAANDVHDFLRAKAEGRVAARPKPVRWRK